MTKLRRNGGDRPRKPRNKVDAESRKGPPKGPKSRQALSDLGGPIRVHGDDKKRDLLASALEAASTEDPDALTHGFHSYPARMHRAVARTLVEALSEPGARVLDPFMGSGTVLVEALVAGRAGLGVDLNPIAPRIARVKTELRRERARQRFADQLQAVGALSEERVRARVEVRAPLPRGEARWYKGHTLKELAGLHAEIGNVTEPTDRRALEMVLSAIVVKFSLQAADTTERTEDKQLRKGLPTEFFVRKGLELVDRWAALSDAAPVDARTPRILQGDVRDLGRILEGRGSAELVLTSPPYGGTYDYVDHHARRYPWLGIDARKMAKGEIGARRNLANEDALVRWDRELAGTLRSIARATAPGAAIVLVLGDAQIGARRVDADAHVRQLLQGTPLRYIATASQARQDRRGGRGRWEHLILLERTDRPSSERPRRRPNR